jgi:ABC-type dipeptide/oligopeptide/nickel transport system ATPase subunit
MYGDQIKSIQKEIEDAQRDKDETSDVKVADLETQLNGLTSLYNELQDDRQVLAAASAMLKDGGIKTKIVNQYVPIINKLINKYLSEFDLFVEFHLDEQFNETIKSRHRDEFSYASFSEGEKQKIDLAILFTWRAVAKLRNSLNTNLLILDEVFDSSLDGNAADDLLKILQALSKDANVFIISHRDNLHDKFTNTIRFVKHKNFSRLEEVQ